MKGYRDVYWENNDRPFDQFTNAIPICVEIVPNAESLVAFEHPTNAVYVFGPEDGGVPQVFRRLCQRFVCIPSAHCLNLAASVNVVLYDRRAKRIQAGLESPLISQNLMEHRGEIDIEGWDGR